MLKATGLGDHENIRKPFTVTEPITVNVYALGEGPGDGEMSDYAWIMNTANRRRVWEMAGHLSTYAGGARKNLSCSSDVLLDPGEYVLQCVTDGSHSMADWNDAPPDDPLNYGVTLTVAQESEKSSSSRRLMTTARM